MILTPPKEECEEAVSEAEPHIPVNIVSRRCHIYLYILSVSYPYSHAPFSFNGDGLMPRPAFPVTRYAVLLPRAEFAKLVRWCLGRVRALLLVKC